MYVAFQVIFQAESKWLHFGNILSIFFLIEEEKVHIIQGPAKHFCQLLVLILKNSVCMWHKWLFAILIYIHFSSK